MSTAQKIGFIGLGIMGTPMAGHLIKGGHQLFVHTIGTVPKEVSDAQIDAYVAAYVVPATDDEGEGAPGAEAQEVALWERWKAGITERQIALNDDMAMVALTMDLAEAMTLPLSVIWSAIRNWIDHGLV